jgi:tetratricopeptide (TPR) repeat protein
VAYGNLGILLDNMGRFEEAEACYRKAVEIQPTHSRPHRSLGLFLEEHDRYAEAESAFRKAIELGPANGDNYLILGRFLDNLKRYEEADQCYQKAAALQVEDADLYASLGNHYGRQGKLAEAEQYYRKAIDLEPREAQHYYFLGHVLKDSHRLEESLKPDHYRALSYLGDVLREMGCLEEALKMKLKSAEIVPRDPVPALGIASLYKSMGNMEAAAKYAEAGRLLLDEHARDYWYQLACVESILGNRELAFERLRKAKEAGNLDPAWAWNDIDLQWIREDPQFEEIVGPNPEQ